MNKLAILITCHNRKEKTISCLKALFNCQIPHKTSFNIYLVDDGSTDGTAEAISLTFPTVNIIQGSGSLFWNRGMHLAWEKAAVNNYDFYLWLNDDTILSGNALEELFSCAEASKSNALICGATCSSMTNTFTYGGRDFNGKAILPNNTFQLCHTMNGNCVLVSKKIFNTVGNLDPVFPHAIGDYEYGLRSIKKGFSIITTRKYIGFCENNPTLPKWCQSKVPLLQRLKSLYSPLGNSHPYYFFIYEKKHWGIIMAIKHFFSIHLRVLIPSLWK